MARGGSAGGLLMGAVANLAPEAFAGIVAQVPFVDPLNSILDPSLPLTVTEWEEWGNPIESADVYAYMKSYSPYENVAKLPVSEDPGGDQPERHPGALPRAGQVDRQAARHRPGRHLPAEDRDGRRARRPERPLRRLEEEAFVNAWTLDVLGKGSGLNPARNSSRARCWTAAPR